MISWFVKHFEVAIIAIEFQKFVRYIKHVHYVWMLIIVVSLAKENTGEHTNHHVVVMSKVSQS